MVGQTYFHTALYSSSIAQSAVNAQVSAVADSILTISSNSFLVPQDADFLASFGISAGLNRLRLDTPKFRYVGLPSLTPVNQGSTVPSVPNVYNGTLMPLRLAKVDQISLQATHDTAGAETVYGVVWFGFGRKNLPAGPIYRLRGTASITVAAGAWSNGTITMDQTLPQGRYAVVNLDVVGANLLAARLIFPGASFRPGVLARESLGRVQADLFRSYDLGIYGEFEMPNLPNLECCGLGSNSSQVVFMDVVRLGDQ